MNISYVLDSEKRVKTRKELLMYISGVGNAQSPKTPTEIAGQSNQTSQNSIFDKNGNNVVDTEDFNNNNALVSIVEKAGWLGRTWDEVGKFLNNMLKNVKTDEASDIQEFLSKMSDKCDVKDGSNLTSVLCAIHNENLEPEQRENLFKKIFKDEYQGYDMYRDGGSIEFNLKNGAKVFQCASISDDEHYGWVVIINQDGSKEVFNDEGEPQPSNSMDGVCRKYNL